MIEIVVEPYFQSMHCWRLKTVFQDCDFVVSFLEPGALEMVAVDLVDSITLTILGKFRIVDFQLACGDCLD